jgi:hypothetical protein
VEVEDTMVVAARSGGSTTTATCMPAPPAQRYGGTAAATRWALVDGPLLAAAHFPDAAAHALHRATVRRCRLTLSDPR